LIWLSKGNKVSLFMAICYQRRESKSI
jgi:hypothetical protein